MRPGRLLLLGGEDVDSLSRQLEELWEDASRAASLAELPAAEPIAGQPLRAALVAPDPEELAQRIEVLSSWLLQPFPQRLRAQPGSHSARARESPHRVSLSGPGCAGP